MAKKSMIAKEKKRFQTVQRYQQKRLQIKARIRQSNLSAEQRERAFAELRKLPRNASPCRLRNRCFLTGRARGYYRKFGLSRNKLREHAMHGNIPGLVKASW